MLQIVVEWTGCDREVLAARYPKAHVHDVTSSGDEPWVRFSPSYPHGQIPVPYASPMRSASVEGLWLGLKVFENEDADYDLFKVTSMKGLERSNGERGKFLGHRRGLAGGAFFDLHAARYELYLPSYKWVLERNLQRELGTLVSLAQAGQVVLLDDATSADVDDLSQPISHAHLIVQYLRGQWPERKQLDQREPSATPIVVAGSGPEVAVQQEVVYYGETPCQATRASAGRRCEQFAYYLDRGWHLCGTHSRKSTRVALPRNPRAAEIRTALLAEREALAKAAAAENRRAGKAGHVIATKLVMCKQPEYHEGYRMVFPNYQHGKRKDGFGCSELSPKAIGPIDHGMPGLPAAKSLENYHQFSKVFRHELLTSGAPTTAFYAARLEGYSSDKPQRHKFPSIKGPNKDAPCFQVYCGSDGKERRYSYLEGRYFYCHWYEKLAPKTKAFQQLQDMIRDGYNLQIVGYDGYPVTKPLMAHYLDTSRPFGHELVLYTLLVEDDPDCYPWNVFYREHTDLYAGMI